MDDTDFEGKLVLEQLAATDLIEDFFDAIDADDVERATVLMRTAKIDASTIAIVIRKMEAGAGITEPGAARSPAGVRGQLAHVRKRPGSPALGATLVRQGRPES